MYIEEILNKLQNDYEATSLVKFDLDTDEYWFSDTLLDYFRELLGFPSNDYLEEFVSCMVADLKMKLLKEVVVNINNFYSYRRNWSVGAELRDKFYYTDEEFRNKIGELLQINGLVENEDVFRDIIKQSKYKLLHTRMPKIAFPWFAYSLCQFYWSLTLDTQKNKLYVVDVREHALKNVGKNLLPTYDEGNQIKVARKKLHLIKRILAYTDLDVNKSLTMFFFNDATNLVDLDTYLSKLTKLYFKRVYYQTANMDELDFLKFIDLEINDISVVSMVKGYYLKHFLIRYIDEGLDLKRDRASWERFNDLLALLKGMLNSEFAQKNDCQQDKIYIYKYQYDVLKDSEPYADLIDQMCRKKQRIFQPTNNYQANGLRKRAMHSLYLATYSIYKHLYKTIYFEDKRKYPFEKY